MNSLATARPLLDIAPLARGRQRAASGQRGAWLKVVGPGVLVSVAYLDPGNVITNIQAGALTGYSLLWVTLFASAIGILFQLFSANLGIVTGKNLAELSREHFAPLTVVAMWVASEVAAMATDLAELLGGAIGIALLCHLPLLPSLAIAAIATYALLALEKQGFRTIEVVIGVLVATMGLAYLAQLWLAQVQWQAVGHGLLVPGLHQQGALGLAVGIVGATVMPHALYLHSGLTPAHALASGRQAKQHALQVTRREVMVTLGIAAAINLAMIITFAAAFHGQHGVTDIEAAHRALSQGLGLLGGGLFLVALLASGLSSSVVGTMAGQIITQGFFRYRIPLWLRRAIVMLPSFVVVAAGVDATKALVVSQIILSLTLPFPMIALVRLSASRRVMGVHRHSPRTQRVAYVAVAVVLAFNLALVVQACL